MTGPSHAIIRRLISCGHGAALWITARSELVSYPARTSPGRPSIRRNWVGTACVYVQPGAPAEHVGGAGAPQAGAALWSFPTGGMVAGIALARGTVFAGSTDGKVYALRASNGRQLWSFAAAGPVESQIAVAGGVAYFGSNDGKVYALKGQPA
jgi:outer membrane protein assembly factor BamB